MGIANMYLLAHRRSLLKACRNCSLCIYWVFQAAALQTSAPVRYLSHNPCYMPSRSLALKGVLLQDAICICDYTALWWLHEYGLSMESCRSATLLTTNPTRTGLEPNPGSRGERPANDLPRDLQLRHIPISRFEEMCLSSVPVLPGLSVGPV